MYLNENEIINHVVKNLNQNTLRQNISHRTKLRNKFLKNPCMANNLAYKSQRNKCVKLLRNEKRRFYNNLNLKCLKDNRTFWRVVKPFFSEKSTKSTKIVLVEENNIISDDSEISETMNNFFCDVVKCLGIVDNYPILSYTNGVLSNIIKTYENHPSIVNILKKIAI